MSAVRIVTVTGNYKAASRTFTVATTVAAQLAELVRADGVEVERVDIDLATIAPGLLTWDAPDMLAAVAACREADALVIASPTYKATYTGLLKLFLDHVGAGELAGVVTWPVMVAAAPQHALAVEVHLKPLLAELGAACVPQGLCLLESELPDLEGRVEQWITGTGAPGLATLRTRAHAADAS
jgi:FMN reductase